MKLNVVLGCLLVFLNSCNYMITRSYKIQDYVACKQNCDPKIVFKKNLGGLNCVYKGSIKLDGTNATINCTKENAYERLKKEANIIDANVINIIDFRDPDYIDCYRCIADFYTIPNDALTSIILAKNKRDTLKYNTRSKLTWDDFKVILPEDSLIPYNIIADINMSSGINIWFGTYKDFKAQGLIYLDVSSVKNSFINDSNIMHVQLIFDLTQIYAKKLEYYVNKDMGKTGNRQRIQDIVENYTKLLKEEIHKYSIETAYGSNKNAQLNWQEKVINYKNELNIK